MPLNLDPHFNNVVLSCPFNQPPTDPYKENIFLGWHMNGYADNGDPYRNNVVLNMRMNETNNSQVFAEDTGKVSTAVGQVKISTDQSKFGGTSAYFGGFGDCISILNSPEFHLSNLDFTIEFWINPTGAAPARIFNNGERAGVNWPCCEINTNVNNTVSLRLNHANSNTSVTFTTTNTITPNQWNHVAFTRSGSTIRGFINGNLDVTGTWNNTIFTHTEPLRIGAFYSSISSSYIEGFAGYLDDLRVTKGVARYAANFTPPTAELPTITGSKFPEVGGTTVALYGSPEISSTTSKFGGFSAKFSGNNQNLSCNFPGSLTGVPKLTVEAWVYLLGPGQGACIFTESHTAGTISVAFGIGYATVSRHPWVGSYNGATPGWSQAISTEELNLGQWYHLAGVFNNNVWKLYVDGVLKATSNSTYLTSYTNVAFIGRRWDSGGSQPWFNGYIDDLVVTKDAKYLSDFTPPTSEFVSATTKLNFKDFSLLPKPVVTYSAPAVITTEGSDYGALFTRVDSVAYDEVASDFTFGTGDFTIEFKIKPFAANPNTYSAALLDMRPAEQGDGAYICIHSDPDGTFGLYVNSAFRIKTTHGWQVDTWYNICVVRKSGITYLYQNGVLKGFWEDITNYAPVTRVFIGRNRVNSTYNFPGFIENLRITKGVNRYVPSFTVPTEQFQEIQHPWYNEGLGYNALPYGSVKMSKTQSKDGGWSAYFDGDDYLSLPASSNYALGTGDFTIEGWFFQTSRATPYPRFFNFADTWNTGDSWGLVCGHNDFDPNRYVVHAFPHNGNVSPLLVSTSTLKIGEWVHLAVCRNGNTFRLFVNGVEEATATWSGSISSSTTVPLHLGTIPGTTPTNAYLNGYIDGFRVTKGVGRYTANFTPATSIPSVSPLLKDEKKNNMRGYGAGAIISTADSKFGGSSAYFNGTNNYIESSLAEPLGGGDFTVELWIKIISASQDRQRFLATCDYNISGGFTITKEASTNKLYFLISDPTTRPFITSDASIIDNTWHHCVFQRRASTLEMFIDGVKQTATATDAHNLTRTTFNIASGFASDSSGWTTFNGYMDDIRVTKGIARYTANFTPTTAQFDSSDPNWNSVVFMSNFNLRDDNGDVHRDKVVVNLPMNRPTNGDSLKDFVALNIRGERAITDDVGTPLTIGGNTSLNYSVKKFGNSSLYFDGNGDCISFPRDGVLLGAQDFTIECWVYKLGNNPNSSRILGTDGDYYHELAFDLTSSGNAACYITTDGSNWNYSKAGPALSDNQWHHLVVQRTGPSIALIVNGVEYVIAGNLGTSSLHPGSRAVRCIGGQSSGVNRSLNGYIDSFRVTIGAARYSFNYNPPTVPFEDFYTISGVVKDDANIPCARRVRAHAKNKPEAYKETISDPVTGEYSFVLPAVEHYLVFFDDDAGTQHNALILDKVVPG